MNLDAQRGLRIREERDKRGWSQQQAADAVGIRREMWAKYEAGAEPGAKALTGMAAVNVDVLYILTGTRTATHAALGHVRTATQAAQKLGGSKDEQAQATEALFNQLKQPVLTRRQRALLDNYEHADESGKKIIEGTASLAAQPKAARGGK